MLAIQPSTGSKPYTPNLLPARLNHNGIISTDQRYWNPTSNSNTSFSDKSNDSNDSSSPNASQTAYFRGRKLQGKPIKLPDGYQGAVLKLTESTIPRQNAGTQTSGRYEEDEELDEAGEDEEEEEEVKIIEQIGEFDEIVLWEHEKLVVESEDPYARGLGEWVGFAGAMHAEEGEEKAA